MFKSDSQTNINTVEFNFSTVLDYIFIIKIILVENVREVLFVAYWVTIFPPKKMRFLSSLIGLIAAEHCIWTSLKECPDATKIQE